MTTTRRNLIEALEDTCIKALDRIEGIAHFQSVGITQIDFDTRMVQFEGESILDAAQTMDDADIADLIFQVQKLKD